MSSSVTSSRPLSTSTGRAARRVVHYWRMTAGGRVRLGPERRGRRACVGSRPPKPRHCSSYDRRLGYARRLGSPSEQPGYSPRAPREGVARDHLSRSPRQGGRPQRVGRRRPAAPALRSGATCRRAASSSCSRDAQFDRLAVEPVRALHGDRRPARGRTRSSRSNRSTRSPRGQRSTKALALVRKHALSGAVLCTHGDVMPMLLEHYDAARRRHRPTTAVAEGLHVGARDRHHRRGRASALSPAAVRVTGTPGAPVDSFAPVERIHRARRDRPSGPRLHAQGPGRQRRDVVVVPRAAERRDRVLPVHVHRRVPGRAVLAARRSLGVRCGEGAGAGDLVRLPARAEAVGRAAGLHLPGAQRLLAARRGGEGLRRLQRATRLREPRDVRDRRRRQGRRHVRVGRTSARRDAREAYEAALAKLS